MRRTLRVLLASIVLAASIGFTPPAAPAAVIVTPDGYTPPPIKIAIVRSETTMKWATARKTPDHYPHSLKELRLLAYLQGRGYDVTQIIGDRDIMNLPLLKQYDVVVLPEVFAISRKASMTLVQYVAEGGGLVELGAVPRAAPEYANKPGTPNHMREWWYHMYGGNHLWEWGPLSQAYQTAMVNDNWTPVYQVRPTAGSSIIASASAIMSARGLPGTAAQTLLRKPGAGLELTHVTKNDPYFENIATFHMLDTKLNKQYRGTYSAGSATRYYLGRSVHFYFALNEFTQIYNSALGNIKTASGIPQGEVAGAWIESAIQWAADADGTMGATTARVTATAKVKASSSGMNSTITLHNGSPLLTYGTLVFNVYSASGKRVHAFSRKGITTAAGTTYKYSDKFSKSLGTGLYTLRVSYDAGYPATSTPAASVATITAGHTVTTK